MSHARQTTSYSRRPGVMAIVVVILLGFAGVAYYLHTPPAVSQEELTVSYSAFEDAYVRYVSESRAQDQAAFRPGSASSPSRQELNALLNQTLSPHTASTTRATQAARGLEVLRTIEREIELIGERSVSVQATIEEMRTHRLGFPNSSTLREHADLLLEYAQSKQDVVETVVETTTAMNRTAGELFKRLLEDRGELTEDHIIYLNDQVDATETLFDRLSRSYSQMEELNARTRDMHDELVRHYSLSIR